MLEKFVSKGTVDALRHFGFEKEARVASAAPPVPGAATHFDLGPAGASGATAAASSAAPSMLGRARNFGMGQVDAAKGLFGNLRQGLGGAASPEAGAAARAAAMGNLRTLAPSLAAGGGLYLLHHHNQVQREEEARQRAMMGGGGGFPSM